MPSKYLEAHRRQLEMTAMAQQRLNRAGGSVGFDRKGIGPQSILDTGGVEKNVKYGLPPGKKSVKAEAIQLLNEVTGEVEFIPGKSIFYSRAVEVLYYTAPWLLPQAIRALAESYAQKREQAWEIYNQTTLNKH